MSEEATRGSIITVAGTDLRDLFTVFGRLGRWEFSVTVNEIGDLHLFQPIPDFVVGVLADSEGIDDSEPSVVGFDNLDVMLRVGRAVERRIPTLVLVPPSIAMPSPTAGVVFAQCDLHDLAALEVHLWSFTMLFKAPNLGPDGGRDADPGKIEAAAVLRELSTLSLGTQFEEFLSRVLQSAGAKLVNLPTSERLKGRVDIAFVPPGDSRSVVLVEVKSGRLSEQLLSGAEDALARFVAEHQASLGALVYRDVGGRSFDVRGKYPFIARIELGQLVERLESDDLTKVLSDAVSRPAESS